MNSIRVLYCDASRTSEALHEFETLFVGHGFNHFGADS